MARGWRSRRARRRDQQAALPPDARIASAMRDELGAIVDRRAWATAAAPIDDEPASRTTLDGAGGARRAA
jgi:hypothetical protein